MPGAVPSGQFVMGAARGLQQAIDLSYRHPANGGNSPAAQEPLMTTNPGFNTLAVHAGDFVAAAKAASP